MKKKLCILAFLSAGFMSIAQVGINTDSPQATLDVSGVPAAKSKLDGIIAPRLTGDQLRAKTYTAAQTGAIVYVSVADSAPAGQTINVNSSGYYYFDGAEWSGLGTNWHTEGNHNTVTPVAALGNDITKGNYLGTSDSRNLVIATKKNVKAILDLDGNLAGGNANSASGPYASFSWGTNNKINDNISSNIALGKDNTVAAINPNYPGVAIGSGNTVADGAKVIGSSNTAKGSNNFVVGNGNISDGPLGLIVGNNNINKGGIIIGGGNSALTNNFVFGSNNKADTGDKALVIGFSGTAGSGQSVYANSTHIFLAQSNGTNSVVGINMIPTTDGSTGAAVQMKGFAAAAAAPCTKSEEGAIRYNSTIHKHEGCNGTIWNALY